MSTGTLTAKELRALTPYLEGEGAKPNGEWDMHCPLHQDTKRSASLNADTGDFYCNTCAMGGSVQWLMMQKDEWVEPDPNAVHNGNGRASSAAQAEELSLIRADSWNDVLLEHEKLRLKQLMSKRGLSRHTIEERLIGWDMLANAYTIPIFDAGGGLLNVRRYSMEADTDRRKIWSISGHGSPVLYPIDQLESDVIIICEGELDALITIQNGYAAITRTGAAKVWDPPWSKLFAGKLVYLCHDADHAGVAANRSVAKHLIKFAREIRFISLPYGITDKHGKDLTDFWLEHDKERFEELLKRSLVLGDQRTKVKDAPAEVSVAEAGDARHEGKPLRLTVQTKGRTQGEYTVPALVKFTCDMENGNKCKVCPMLEAEGEMEDQIDPNERDILSLMNSTDGQMREILRERNLIVKCPRFEVDILEHQSVEHLVVIPSIDHTKHQITGGDYKSIEIISVGRQDTSTGITVQVTGTLHSDPRSQLTRFQAWEVNPLETSLDRYELTADEIKLCKSFQPGPGETPYQKMARIALDLSRSVTKIYGRPEMHVMMDLVFHSALRFEFNGVTDDRGWMEALILGDTRTGKSEAAQRLVEHYGAGELISCETASIPGILGGLEQRSNGWSVSWGAVPLNDRRLVVLDEISGLSVEQISQLSALRSSGVAQLQKVLAERANARTRLLWLSNPRNGKAMASYQYGVDAVQPLIGNHEDISRFDIAMTVANSDVDASSINVRHKDHKTRYTSKACNALIHWAWSRKPEQIKWTDDATDACLKAALEMGDKYNQNPPLVQAAAVRWKLARMATAIAMRLFSADENLNCVVTVQHVKAAAAFMDRVYGMPGFGYLARSERKNKDKAEAVGHLDDVVAMLHNMPQANKFLQNIEGQFKPFDMASAMGGDAGAAHNLCNALANKNMIHMRKGLYFLGEEMMEVLRKVAK